MTNIIFSGLNKKLFNSLSFNHKVNAKWLSVDELVNSDIDTYSNDTKFILFYNSPESFLASLGNMSFQELTNLEQQWIPQIQQLTQFYLGNNQSSLLIEEEQCNANFSAFIKVLQEKLVIWDESITINDNALNLGALLANQSLQLSLIHALNDNYDVQDTFENVACAGEMLVDGGLFSIEERQFYLEKNCDELIENISNVSCLFDKTKEENELSLLQIQQLQEELEALFTQKRETEDRFQNSLKNMTDTSDISTLKNQELTTENEVSLLQIQQLQEELEALFTQKKEKELLIIEVKQLQGELDNKSKENKTKEALYKKLSSTQSKLEAQVAKLTDEKDLSIIEVKKLQENLDNIFTANKEKEERYNKITAGQPKLEAKVTNLTEDKATLEQDISSLKVENKVARMQIHELQEELELYFIKYQTLNTQTVISNLASISESGQRFEKSLTLAKILSHH